MAIKNLFDLSRDRSFKECVAFYFACFFMVMLIISIVMLINFFILEIGITAKLAIKIGLCISIIFCAILSASIVTKKGMWKSFRSNLLFLMAILSSLIGGALLGLIPVCMLYYAPAEKDE